MPIPAERISELHRYYGSDDKLAEAINERFDTHLARQTVIRWRKGRGGISERWAEILAEFTGLEPEDFRESAAAQRQARRQLEERMTELENWRREIDELLDRTASRVGCAP